MQQELFPVDLVKVGLEYKARGSKIRVRLHDVPKGTTRRAVIQRARDALTPNQRMFVELKYAAIRDTTPTGREWLVTFERTDR